MAEGQERFFSKEAWKGIAIAIIVVVAGQIVLAWQYYRLEEKRLPLIEQELAEQREEIERQGARKAIVFFLDARQEGNANLALRFLTENAVLQVEQEDLVLEQGFLSYEIKKLEKIGPNEFRAQVLIQKAEGLPENLEILRLVKILDSYYIDSLDMAG